MVLHSRCDPEDSSCGSPVWSMSLVFGVLQLGFSQMPSLEAAWWSSMVGAVMSVAYSTAALGMGGARGGVKMDSSAGRGRWRWPPVVALPAPKPLIVCLPKALVGGGAEPPSVLRIAPQPTRGGCR